MLIVSSYSFVRGFTPVSLSHPLLVVESGGGVGWGELKPLGLKRDLSHDSDILTFSFLLPSYIRSALVY